MPWTVAEFSDELERDTARRVLFVEGTRDVAFWKTIVPVNMRGDTVIYPISEILNDSVNGGERGRLLWYAQLVVGEVLEDRIRFFADADNDRILQRDPPRNVTFTDGRDLESYAICEPSMIRLSLQGIGVSESDALGLLPVVVAVARPIGLLRILAAREEATIAFQRTFEGRTFQGNRLPRFLKGGYLGVTLDFDRLIGTLLQNSSIALDKKSEYLEKYKAEEERCNEIENNQVIHGKDFVRTLSSVLKIDHDNMERMIFLAVEMNEVRQFPNVEMVERWIRGV